MSFFGRFFGNIYTLYMASTAIRGWFPKHHGEHNFSGNDVTMLGRSPRGASPSSASHPHSVPLENATSKEAQNDGKNSRPARGLSSPPHFLSFRHPHVCDKTKWLESLKKTRASFTVCEHHASLKAASKRAFAWQLSRNSWAASPGVKRTFGTRQAVLHQIGDSSNPTRLLRS